MKKPPNVKWAEYIKYGLLKVTHKKIIRRIHQVFIFFNRPLWKEIRHYKKRVKDYACLVRSYTESGYQPIASVRLSDDEYGRGLQCFVPACTDIVPIDVSGRAIYLARRASKPMTGWWWIGGRMVADETKEEAAARNLKRETGLDLPSDRFNLVAVFDYRWKDRAQSPQGIGCHMLGYTFTVELTAVEIASVATNLDKDEYEQGTGLFAFDRERLVKEDVFPAILDFYDHIFSRQ